MPRSGFEAVTGFVSRTFATASMGGVGGAGACVEVASCDDGVLSIEL
jgi:hypothetical protein